MTKIHPTKSLNLQTYTKDLGSGGIGTVHVLFPFYFKEKTRKQEHGQSCGHSKLDIDIAQWRIMQGLTPKSAVMVRFSTTIIECIANNSRQSGTRLKCSTIFSTLEYHFVSTFFYLSGRAAN